MEEVELEYKGKEIRKIKEEERTFLRYDLLLVGIKIHIWADEKCRIYLMDVPVQYAAYVREGFDELLSYRAEDPLLSKTVFEVRTETVKTNRAVPIKKVLIITPLSISPKLCRDASTLK
mgnify:CR=1 FL=1